MTTFRNISLDFFTNKNQLIPIKTNSRGQKLLVIPTNQQLNIFTKTNGLSKPVSLGFLYYHIHYQGISREVYYHGTKYISRKSPTQYFLSNLEYLVSFSRPLLNDCIYLFYINNKKAYPAWRITLT
ncbi:hypothetical protein HC864_04775 [Candidatus Gracilibacteria bacterium]|nr:hypothetical protein [Candidatus Gracilibacteria bacterium]